MDEKDSMTPDTIPQSTPVDGTVPAGRKNRRPVVIGVAAVAAVALVAGGVCGYMAYENHRAARFPLAGLYGLAAWKRHAPENNGWLRPL